jgi:hypothetical protein
LVQEAPVVLRVRLLQTVLQAVMEVLLPLELYLLPQLALVAVAVVSDQLPQEQLVNMALMQTVYMEVQVELALLAEQLEQALLGHLWGQGVAGVAGELQPVILQLEAVRAEKDFLNKKIVLTEQQL